MRLLPTATVAIALLCLPSACGPRIAINRAALPCSKLVPEQLARETPGADLPDMDADLKGWQIFADAQTGQLDKANLTKGAALDIIRKCEARDSALDEKIARR
jgi:hypothetical protein